MRLHSYCIYPFCGAVEMLDIFYLHLMIVRENESQEYFV